MSRAPFVLTPTEEIENKRHTVTDEQDPRGRQHARTNGVEPVCDRRNPVGSLSLRHKTGHRPYEQPEPKGETTELQDEKPTQSIPAAGTVVIPPLLRYPDRRSSPPANPRPAPSPRAPGRSST